MAVREEELLSVKRRFGIIGNSPSLNHAIEVARNQHARSLEIRPAISLSNLLREKGQASDARQLLSGAYEQFTEGFDAPDLLQAKDLLDQLE